MCGIVGVVSERNVTPVLTECLKRLEYRGYDSAGVAVIEGQLASSAKLHWVRAVGKIAQLEDKLTTDPIHGHLGIAHTRWATHGAPTLNNAHPQISHDVLALVHNGIIENHAQLRHQLMEHGSEFTSDTDTEVIVHLIYEQLSQTQDFLQAVHKAVNQLKGSYALAVVHQDDPDCIITVRSGSPVVIGLGINENFVASDTVALLPLTKQFIYLENHDFAVVKRTGVQIYDQNLQPITRPIKVSELSADHVVRGDYQHFMHKEIFEQPRALTNTLAKYLTPQGVAVASFGQDAATIFQQTQRVQIAACGSSLHAALVAAHWIEELAGIPCRTEIASEFCYRPTVTEPNTLFVTISQSGETADTLAALHKAQQLPFLATLTICNVPESSLVRESDLVGLTQAGIEVGVATTKAFTAQLAALLILTIALSNRTSDHQERNHQLIQQLHQLPDWVEQILQLEPQIANLAELLVPYQHAFYLGRGINYPIAMEGALKIKEIAYIHAESYAAGELKHGALALIDANTPVVAVLPCDRTHVKLLSNLQEASLRGSELIIFADQNMADTLQAHWHCCPLPSLPPIIAPIIYTIPLQMLAYQVALRKGTDIDQPRHLAKSVTVE